MLLTIYGGNVIVIRMGMYPLGAFLLASIIACQPVNADGVLDKLKNVVTLTATNFDSELATKYHFVLFYGSRYAS